MPNPDIIRHLLVFVALLCLIGTFKRPFWGVVSYLIIMVTRPGLYYPAMGSIRIELVVGVLMLLAIIFKGTQRISISQEPVCKWTFAFYGVVILSMLQAFNFDAAWARTIEFTKVVVFFLMIVSLLDSRKDVEVLLWIFCILTFFFAYQAIYNYKIGNLVISQGTRVDYAIVDKGMGSGHVALANLILQGMPFLWYLSLNSKKGLKISGLFALGACAYGVIISGSRGGFVGLVVLYLLFLFFSKKRLALACLGLVIFMCLPLITSSGYMDYMSSVLGIFTWDAGVSVSSRNTGFRNGLEMMIRRPVLGVGPGCYPFARKAWFGWGLWSHNHYGQLMGDLGMLGVITWFGFFYHYLKGAIDLKKITDKEPGNCIIFTAIIVASILRLVLGYGSHSLYIFFWYLLAGIIIVEKRILNEDLKPIP